VKKGTSEKKIAHLNHGVKRVDATVDSESDATCPTKGTKDVPYFSDEVLSIAVTFVCHSHHFDANERSCRCGAMSRCFYLPENVGEKR